MAKYGLATQSPQTKKRVGMRSKTAYSALPPRALLTPKMLQNVKPPRNASRGIILFSFLILFGLGALGGDFGGIQGVIGGGLPRSRKRPESHNPTVPWSNNHAMRPTSGWARATLKCSKLGFYSILRLLIEFLEFGLLAKTGSELIPQLGYKK